MIRRIGRAFCAVLIGVSVATLPATMGFSAVAAVATEINATMAMPDCDHRHNPPANQPRKAINGACLADCALSCFGFTVTGYSGISFSPVHDALKPVRVSDAIFSRMGNPPFRPPRS
ncbi:MAG: hypothetical protein HY543_03505 [Deltaproteobacteria bacterium]|nr:hypothetical protein [Deltaproteobacteria bacterium]